MSIMMAVVLSAVASAPPLPTPTPAPAAMLATHAGNRQPGTGSLAALASRVKLRLGQGEERVITNESLKTLGAGVELTTSTVALPVGSSDSGQQADSEEAQKQALWQQRYQDARAELDSLEQQVQRLEGDVGRLETEFYSTDDPARRDNVVKPAWDQALSDLEATRERLATARSAPDNIRDEALRDGAMPGWFRGLPTPDKQPGAQDNGNAGGG